MQGIGSQAEGFITTELIEIFEKESKMKVAFKVI